MQFIMSIRVKSEKIRNEDKGMLLPWLSWSHDFLALAMSSVKAWLRTGSDAQPGLRLLQDSADVLRLLQLNEMWMSPALNPSPIEV
jgi:hypothetical protein